MRRKLYWALGLAVVVAVVVWHDRYVSGRLDTMRRSVIELEKSGRSTTEEVQALANRGMATRYVISSQVQPATEERGQPMNTGSSSPTGEAPVDPGSDSNETRDPDAPDAVVQKAMVSLASAFDSQLVDRNWAADASASIRDKARELLGQNAEIKSIECRSTMCRMETAQPNLKEYQDFGLEFAKSKAFPQVFLTQTGATSDGRTRWACSCKMSGLPLRCYVARPNERDQCGARARSFVRQFLLVWTSAVAPALDRGRLGAGRQCACRKKRQLVATATPLTDCARARIARHGQGSEASKEPSVR